MADPRRSRDPVVLDGDGSLVDQGTVDESTAGAAPLTRDRDYVADPTAAPATCYEGSSNGIWSVDVVYDWQEGAAGTSPAS